MTSLDVHVADLTKQITFRVRGLKVLGVRFWVARQLFFLGARIARVGIIMEPGEPIEAPSGKRPPPPPNTPSAKGDAPIRHET